MDNLVFAANLAYPLIAHVISTARDGIIEKLGGDITEHSWNQLGNNLKKYSPDGNHEIQKAVHRAYLQATLQICAMRGEQIGMSVNWCVVCELMPKVLAKAEVLGRKAANLIDPSLPSLPANTEELRRRRYRELPKDLREKAESFSKTLYEKIFGEIPQPLSLKEPQENDEQLEREWIDKVKNEYIELLTLLDERKLSFPEKPEDEALDEILREAGLLMQPKEAREKEKEIRQKLLDRVSEELCKQFGAMPLDFKKFFDENWFNYFCGCFQYQLGKNSNIADKFQSKLLAGIDVKQDQLIASFDRFGGEVRKRLENLETLIDTRYQAVLDLLLRLSADVHGLNRDVSEIKSLIQSFNSFLALIDSDEAKRKISVSLQPEFQNVIDVILEELRNSRDEILSRLKPIYDLIEKFYKEWQKEIHQTIEAEPETCIAALPNWKVIGREDECALLLEAMRAEENKRVLIFTAPGGFGKTALLTKFIGEKLSLFQDDNKRAIAEMSVQALFYQDCRGGVNMTNLIETCGRLVGKAQMYKNLSQQLLSAVSAQTNLNETWQKLIAASEEIKSFNQPEANKLHAESKQFEKESGKYQTLIRSIMAALLEGLTLNRQKKVWIVFDNFEDLLNEQDGKIADAVLREFFYACFLDNNRVHFLLASRKRPVISPNFEEQARVLESSDNCFTKD